MDPNLQRTERGIYVPAGDFFVDPWKPVERAVVTHAHADHARPGHRNYLTTPDGEGVLRPRVGDTPTIETLAYGESRRIGDAVVSLHPAGHLLGSAQVRIEIGGRVTVISGDYKTEVDATCVPFEPVRCDCFITESTFGLPIYRWEPQQRIFDDVNAWWRGAVERGRSAVLFSYSLGKAQRLISGLDASIGPILLHGAVEGMTEAYRAAGVALPPTRYASPEAAKESKGQAMIVAPPSAAGTPWMRKFGRVETAFASGWMRVRGMRRRRVVDRGFILSDHADWDGLLQSIEATGAESIGVTHGSVNVLVRWLKEQGRDAWVLPTHFESEEALDPDAAESAAATPDKPGDDEASS